MCLLARPLAASRSTRAITVQPRSVEVAVCAHMVFTIAAYLAPQFCGSKNGPCPRYVGQSASEAIVGLPHLLLQSYLPRLSSYLADLALDWGPVMIFVNSLVLVSIVRGVLAGIGLARSAIRKRPTHLETVAVSEQASKPGLNLVRLVCLKVLASIFILVQLYVATFATLFLSTHFWFGYGSGTPLAYVALLVLPIISVFSLRAAAKSAVPTTRWYFSWNAVLSLWIGSVGSLGLITSIFSNGYP